MKEFFIVDRGEKINVLHDEFENPKCILVHLHGLNSHFQYVKYCQNEFKYRIKYFQKALISSYGLEFKGHGKSGGEKGCIEDFDIIITNVLSLLVYIEFKHPNLPIYILGESMGAAVAIKIGILSKKISGIVLLAPMCGIYEGIKPSQFKINCLLKLSKIFPKWKLIGTQNDNNATCKNLEYNESRKYCIYEYTGKIMLSTARECYKTVEWIESKIEYFNTPVLAIHSKQDMVTSIKNTQHFINNCKSEDKELYMLDTGCHRLLIPEDNMDVIPDGILSKITNWINNRI